MTGTPTRESAKIYQFPAGGRDALNAERAGSRFAQDPPLRAAKVVYGSGWYHEAAVLEVDPAGQK